MMMKDSPSGVSSHFVSCWSRCAPVTISSAWRFGGLCSLSPCIAAYFMPVARRGGRLPSRGQRCASAPCGVWYISRSLVVVFFSRSILLDGKQRRRLRVEVDGSPEWRGVFSGASTKYHTTAWLKLGVKGQAKSTEYVANRQRALI